MAHPEDGDTLPARKDSEAAATSVKDPFLYELLGVPVGTSNASVLKKAYYVRARDLHPDKNLQDEAATERFQTLGEAYQILSDDESRKLYNQLGWKAYKDRTSSGETMDMSVLFTMLFGNEKFEDYCGTFNILELAKMAQEEEEQATSENGDGEGHSAEEAAKEREAKKAELEEMEKAKLEQLVQNLLNKVRLYVDGQHAEFMEKVRAEAEELIHTTFAGPILTILGSVYLQRANIFLGRQTKFGFGGSLASMKYSYNLMGSQLRTVISAYKVVQRQQNMQEYLEHQNNKEESSEAVQSDEPSEAVDAAEQREDKQQEGGEEDEAVEVDELAAKVAQKSAIDIIELLWSVTSLDILTTADQVTKRVLDEATVGEDVPNEVKDEFFALLGQKMTAAVGEASKDKGSSADGVEVRTGNAPSPTWSRLWGAIQSGWSGKPQLAEGQRPLTKGDVLRARAAALRTLGEVFMEVGVRSSASDEVLKALGMEKKEAEELESMALKMEEDERARKKAEKEREALERRKDNSAKKIAAAEGVASSES